MFSCSHASGITTLEFYELKEYFQNVQTAHLLNNWYKKREDSHYETLKECT